MAKENKEPVKDTKKEPEYSDDYLQTGGKENIEKEKAKK